MTVDESPAAVRPDSIEESEISYNTTESTNNNESGIENVDDIANENATTTIQEIIPDRIFVGNLPYEVTEEQVRNLTPEFDVVSVEIPRKNYYNQHLNRYVLQSKGYGFITYVNADDAREAIASIVGKFISGREIYAKYALPQNKNKFIQQQGHHQQQQNHHQQLHQQSQQQQQQQQQSQHQLQQHRIPSHSQPYPFHIQPNLRNGGFPLPPGGNFYPAFIPVPMSQNSNSSNNSESNQNGNVNNVNSNQNQNNYYYNEIPTIPVINLPPIKFNDPNSITPFYPQKLELPTNNKFERRKKLENGKPSKLTIFIGNLDRNITHYELEEYLISKGLEKPIRIKIPKKNLQPEIYQMLKLNRVKIQNKGIGFVKFSNHNEQIKAIEICNGDIWNGKKLNVTIAINVEDEENEESEEIEEIEENKEIVEDIEVSNDTPLDDSDTEVEVVISE